MFFKYFIIIFVIVFNIFGKVNAQDIDKLYKKIDLFSEVLEKIKKLRKIQDERNLNFDIEIDGGINFENCKKAIDAGANILVSGTTIFKSNDGDIKKNINLLKLK